MRERDLLVWKQNFHRGWFSRTRFRSQIGETSCKPQHSSTSQPSAIPYSTTSYNTIHFHTRPCHETPATMEIPPLTMSGQSHEIRNIMNLLKILNTYWKKTAASTQFADNSFGIPLPLRGKLRNIMNAYLKKTAASMQFANNSFGNGFTCTSCWYVVLQHLVWFIGATECIFLLTSLGLYHFFLRRPYNLRTKRTKNNSALDDASTLDLDNNWTMEPCADTVKNGCFCLFWPCAMIDRRTMSSISSNVNSVIRRTISHIANKVH